MPYATTFSVLSDFLTSFFLFCLTVFSLLYLSELGSLRSGVEQASFFAARSEFVGLRGARSGRWMARLALDPTFRRSETEIQFQVIDREIARGTHVTLPFSTDLPLISQTPRRLSGFTAIPPRGSE